jgi:hypothetical protein
MIATTSHSRRVLALALIAGTALLTACAPSPVSTTTTTTEQTTVHPLAPPPVVSTTTTRQIQTP